MRLQPGIQIQFVFFFGNACEFLENHYFETHHVSIGAAGCLRRFETGQYLVGRKPSRLRGHFR